MTKQESNKVVGYSDALEFYGSVKRIGRAFKPALSRQSVNKWQGVIPELRCHQLEAATKGKNLLNFKTKPYLKSAERKENIIKKESRRLKAKARKEARDAKI